MTTRVDDLDNLLIDAPPVNNRGDRFMLLRSYFSVDGIRFGRMVETNLLSASISHGTPTPLLSFHRHSQYFPSPRALLFVRFLKSLANGLLKECDLAFMQICTPLTVSSGFGKPRSNPDPKNPAQDSITGDEYSGM
jgi:hypothetical protein